MSLRQLMIILLGGFFITLSLPALSSYEGSEIFKNLPHSTTKSAKNTFVFWINGDAQRFRSENDSKKITRIDAMDANKIRKSANTCNCNIILFHDQRGTDKWYTNSKHWAAYLEVYQNGKKLNFPKVISRRAKNKIKKFTIHKDSARTAEINQANMNFLTDLLVFSENMFPKSKIHLIYRGHSFSQPYIPNQQLLIAPFDYSSIDTPYSMGSFIESIKNARLSKKLGSITFAACTMSYIEFFNKLSSFANHVVASQIPVLETTDTGFNFDFLNIVRDQDSDSEIANIIFNQLLKNFDNNSNFINIIREAILTKLNLINIEKHQSQIQSLVEALRQEHKNYKGVFVRPSQTYIEEKRKQGTSESTINILKERIKFEGVPNTADFLLSINENKLLAEEFYFILNLLRSNLSLKNYSHFTGKSGLNFMLENE